MNLPARTPRRNFRLRLGARTAFMRISRERVRDACYPGGGLLNVYVHHLVASLCHLIIQYSPAAQLDRLARFTTASTKAINENRHLWKFNHCCITFFLNQFRLTHYLLFLIAVVLFGSHVWK
jgi:hypothetical protein